MRRTGLAVVAALSAAPVAAQDAGRAADRALAPLVACRQTTDPRARAACYDAALDQLQGAVANRQVVIVDREQAVQDRRGQFGFGASNPAPIPKLPRPAKAAGTRSVQPDEVMEIDTTVVSASQTGFDQWTVRLATGAVWRTTEAGSIAVPPRPGTKVHIHRSLMGGFMMKIGSYRPVRAIRVG